MKAKELAAWGEAAAGIKGNGVYHMKKVRKIAALLMALSLAAASAACSTDKSWALKRDQESIPIGVYIYYLFAAYQNGSSQVADTSKPVLEQKIENKDAKEWIRAEALNYTKSIFVLNDKMKELGLKLSADEEKNISAGTESQWAQASATLEKYGVSKTSFNLAYSDYAAKYQKVFDALYGKGGKQAVSDADLKAYFEKNYSDFSYLYAPLTKTDASGASAAMTQAEKDAVKKQFDGYASDVSSGKKTIKQAADAYKTASKATADPLQNDTVVLDTSGYPTTFKSLVTSLKPGEVKTLEVSDVYIVVQKNDIKKKTSSYLSEDTNRNALLAQMKGTEFSDSIKKAADALKDLTVNDKALNSYDPSMFVTTSSSAAAVSAASAG